MGPDQDYRGGLVMLDIFEISPVTLEDEKRIGGAVHFFMDYICGNLINLKPEVKKKKKTKELFGV